MARKTGRWFLVVLCVLVGALVVAFLVVKREVRKEIEDRCSVALQGVCTIDDLSVSPDGAAAHGIHLAAKLGLASGDIESIAVQFAWWPLITGEKQGVSVKIVAPGLSGGLPIGNLVREGRQMGEGLSSNKTPSRVRLDALTLERGEVSVNIPLLVDARIESINADWKRAAAFSLHWEDASLKSLIDERHTGECKVTSKKNTEKVSIDCGKLSTTVDVENLESVADLVKLLARPKK